MQLVSRVALGIVLAICLIGIQETQGQFSNGQSAAGVLGPADLVTRPTGQTTANKFNGPNGVAIDPLTRKVFVVDRANNRILRWASTTAMSNGSDAEAVLGQTDFTTAASGLSASKFNAPIGVCVDREGRLWVGDYGNHRVLRFDDVSSKTNGASADGVLGQPDFTTNAASTTQAGLNGPVGLHVDKDGRLWVSGFLNHRVTRYDNAAAKPNGGTADGVLGQPDYTTSTSGLAQNKLNNPNSVWVDEDGRLWVSDYGNRRAVRFDNAAAKVNGANADGVLGQPDFITNTATLSRSGFNTTRFVTSDPTGRLYVVEEANNRVMIFNNAGSLPNGANADYVLGQSDFTTNTAPNPPSAATLAVPRAAVLDVVSGSLWLADWANHRVIRYEALPFAITNTQAAVGVLGPADLVTRPAGQTTANKLNGPNGVAIDPLTRKVFVADRTNNRILRWSSTSAIVNGSDAEAVLGQTDFTTATSGLSASKLSAPIGVHVDGAGRLWVADFGNNRVLRFDNASTKANGASADGVLGQPDFTTKVAATTQAGLNGPVTTCVDREGRLWVVSFSNHRVTRYDAAANKPNGGNADGVLGQPDYSTGTSGLAQDKLANPNGVWVDEAGRLWVSDYGNRRALRFDLAASKPNGANADGVLGQPDFVTNTASLSRSRFNYTRFVCTDATGRLYVVEEANNRIMVFNNAATLANGADADYVLGQVDFTSNAAPNPPSATSCATPRAIAVDNLSGNLWLADWANNRVIRYSFTYQGPTAVQHSFVEVPVELSLSQNYPNPFNPSTNIQYRTATVSTVSLKVFDLLGREVATLVDEVKQPGEHTVQFDASGLSSGVYFYRVSANGLQQSKKMVVMR